ncbi:unnamed protein product [Sphagnum compactum]
MAAVPGCSTSFSLPLASLAKLHLLTSNTRQNIRTSMVGSIGSPIRRTEQGGSMVYNQGLQHRTSDQCTVRAVESNQGREAETSSSSPESSDTSIEELEARIGIGRRARRERGGDSPKVVPTKVDTKPKMWDEMSLPEKTWSLYIGEKGVLFWLNKLAYASIFLVIGGWIVFRFIGPALGWYELDSGLLPPSQLLAGSGGR